MVGGELRFRALVSSLGGTVKHKQFHNMKVFRRANFILDCSDQREIKSLPSGLSIGLIGMSGACTESGHW